MALHDATWCHVPGDDAMRAVTDRMNENDDQMGERGQILDEKMGERPEGIGLIESDGGVAVDAHLDDADDGVHPHCVARPQ